MLVFLRLTSQSYNVSLHKLTIISFIFVPLLVNAGMQKKTIPEWNSLIRFSQQFLFLQHAQEQDYP